VAVGVAAQAMLGGMPESRELRRTEVDGQVLITVGATVIAGYQADDAVMRNITAVALTGLGFSGRRVGELLGITEQYVSMLRGRARRHGSEGLAPRRGRPPALGRGDLARARRLREQGQSDMEIGRRLGVHATTVGRALPARRLPPPATGSKSRRTVPTSENGRHLGTALLRDNPRVPGLLVGNARGRSAQYQGVGTLSGDHDLP
jgi:predicted transcriptional regulator